MGHVQISRLIPAPKDEVYNYITDLRHLPEWLGPASFSGLQVEFPEGNAALTEQAEFAIVFVRFGFSVRAVGRVDELVPGERFTYRQVSGFFRSWSHSQILSTHDPRTTLLTDIVDFNLRFGLLGALADDVLVRGDLQRILRDRLLRIEDHFNNASRVAEL